MGAGGWGWGWAWQGMPPGEVSVYFEDSFTDDNGVALADHAPDVDVSGGGWTEDAGSWLVSGNQITPNDSEVEHQATCDVSQADGTVEVDCCYTTNTGDIPLGLILRGDSDLSNCWHLRLNPSNDRLELVKVEEGQVPSVEKYVTITDNFQDNTTYTVQAVLSDASFTIHAICGETDDSVSHSSDFQKAGTRHGLLGYCKTAYDYQWFDDFSVTP